jgi:tetratricopeptide (TPR) repeat protein
LGQGRYEEAIAAGERGVALAPLDYWSSFTLSVTYLHAQQFDKAIERLRKTVDIDPGSPIGYGVLAQAYAGAGQREHAIRECQLALALDRKTSMLVLQAAVAYAMVHEIGEARKIAEEVEKNWKPDGVSAFWLASACACLDDPEKAFEWLNKSYREHAPFLGYLKIMWTHARLRSDPRFAEMLKRVGIPG